MRVCVLRPPQSPPVQEGQVRVSDSDPVVSSHRRKAARHAQRRRALQLPALPSLHPPPLLSTSRARARAGHARRCRARAGRAHFAVGRQCAGAKGPEAAMWCGDDRRQRSPAGRTTWRREPETARRQARRHEPPPPAGSARGNRRRWRRLYGRPSYSVKVG